MGQITFWSLLLYLGFRLGDLAARGQLAAAFSGKLGALFAAEIVLGGVLPLLLLSSRALRLRPALLFLGTFLAAGGIVLNRIDVVLLSMDLKGSMPGFAPKPYTPSVVEWGISIGLIAATVFLFGIGARLLPVLAKTESERAH
jgi:formate dehydrogenase iron-sulfur subunit